MTISPVGKVQCRSKTMNKRTSVIVATQDVKEEMVKVKTIPNPVKSSKVSNRPRDELEITRVMKQYLYDERRNEYLDCVNSVAHVGHGHPNVTMAAQMQMGKLQTCHGFITDHKPRYVQRLVDSFPEPLSVCYLCNSGTEANDLALRMAMQFTGHSDVVVVEGGEHGTTGTLIDISTSIHQHIPNYKQKDWVHVIPLPSRIGRSEAEVDVLLEKIERQGKGVACFLCEPLFVSQGVHEAPEDYFPAVYRSIRRKGGVIIADESKTGLGRLGDHMWGFKKFGVVPDIVTIGKSLGNGFPLAAVVCTKEISDKLGGYFSTYGGNPVACAIGTSVLDTIAKEQLMSSARMVGRNLKQSSLKLRDKFEILGDVRGEGLLFALELVNTKNIRTSLTSLGRDLMIRLKNSGVLVDVKGKYSNVIMFSPPMCFTMDNGRRFIKALDQCLVQITEKLKEETKLLEDVENENLPNSKRFRMESEERGNYDVMD